MLLILFAGCASNSTRNRGSNVTTITINEGERIAEARRLAAQAQTTKDPAEAVRLYRRSVAAWADFPAAWNNLGVLLLDQQQYLGAAEAFQSAAERSATDPRPLYNLGLTWERTRHLQEAQEQYARALDLDPRYLPALRGVIYAQDRLGIVDDQTLARLRIALLRENEQKWRAYFEMRKISAEAEIAEQQ